jgi:septal ring factor EnvC (AmiA/AmiB activator)
VPPRASAAASWLLAAVLPLSASAQSTTSADKPGRPAATASAAPSGISAARGAAAKGAPTPTTGSPAAARGTAAGGAQRQRQLQGEQQQLQARLAQARRLLGAAEASHSEATDALRLSESAISTASRRLHDLAIQRSALEKQLATLMDRGRDALVRQGREEQQLAAVLRAQVLLLHQPPWIALTGTALPQQTGQDMARLGYLARAGVARIDALDERRAELAALEAETRARQADLAAVERDEESSRAQLVEQQRARRETLNRMARQIGAQRQSVTTLERDERRLGQLVEELARVLAERAERDERARRSAQASGERARTTTASAAPMAPRPTAVRSGPSEPRNSAAAEPPADSRFAQARGKLVAPVQGEISARFGSSRSSEPGSTAPTWKGVFIRAPEGTEVRAVAAGRVLFADWLRGFGNLLILDHGEGILSVYGNNETVLVSSGERVESGARVATVGTSGGHREPGLYFEMRYEGRPFDPLRWLAAR